jgi:hypothetical protein
MIGCIIVGGLAVLGIARIARHRYRGGWGCGGPCGGGGGMAHGGEDWDAETDNGSPVWPDGSGFAGRHGHRAWFRHASNGGNPLLFQRGRMFVIRRVLSRLETTPTQTQALREAVKEFRQGTKGVKGEAERTRADLATALRGPSIDAEAMGELFARHDSALDVLRKAFVGMTMKVHDILDETQRERLAQLIELGPRWFRGPMASSTPPSW